MSLRMLPGIAAVAAVVAFGTIGIAVMADPPAHGGPGVGFLQHLHGLAGRFHEPGHHGGPMVDLIERLDLTDDQHRHLERVQEIFGSFGGGDHEAMADLHEKLVAEFESGTLSNVEFRRVIDHEVEGMREMAYAVTDELVALVNELNGRQREILLEHLQGHDRPHHP